MPRSQETERKTKKTAHPNSLANLKPIQPGQALNPSDRPKVPAEVREAAMALTVEAIETLGHMMRDPSTPPATRVTAADKILDRALGRPAQQVDVTTRKDALDYSLADLLAIAYGRGVGAATIDGEVVQPGSKDAVSAEPIRSLARSTYN